MNFPTGGPLTDKPFNPQVAEWLYEYATNAQLRQELADKFNGVTTTPCRRP